MTVVHSLSGVIYYFTKDSLTFAVLQGNLIREEIVVNVREKFLYRLPESYTL